MMMPLDPAFQIRKEHFIKTLFSPPFFRKMRRKEGLILYEAERSETAVMCNQDPANYLLIYVDSQARSKAIAFHLSQEKVSIILSS